MKMKLRGAGLWAVLVGAALYPRIGDAEGGCPAGMYPIHSPGVMGCAPMPSPPSAPGPRWLSKWGAVATDAENAGPHGVSNNERSERRATKLAMERCRKGGGKRCEISATYSNACYFSAMPHDGQVFVPGFRHFAWGPRAEEAEGVALEKCQASNHRQCRIEYSACSLPVLVE